MTFWTSTNSRDTKSFGYTYPEVSNTTASPEELRQIVMRAVMELYGPNFNIQEAGQASGLSTSFIQSTAKSRDAPANRAYINFAPLHFCFMAEITDFSTPAGHEQSAPSTAPPRYPNRYNDWFVTVTVNPYQFTDSGFVYIFLCDSVPSGNWMFAPERVGDVGIFRNTSGQCENCNQRQAAGETITGHVPLTR